MLCAKLCNWGRRNTAIVVACCLTGCADKTDRDTKTAVPVDSQGQQQSSEPSEIVAQEIRKVADKKLFLSKSDEKGQLQYLGMLQFDDSNRATLTTEGSGPDVEKLKQDWEEVSSLKELMWKQSVPDEIDGKRVMRVVGETVRPGDDDYIYAVFNTMERLYGYRAELGE